MPKRIKFTIAVIISLIPFLQCRAQKVMSQMEYAEKYAPLAIKQMQEFRIPASITLAQGILESGCGGSRLAKIANNHFGIKCKGDWKGMTISHDDDEKGECFRKYSSVEDSYYDHSVFLTTRDRYRALFELDIKDYKGWAYGLKDAGYATNPVYAYSLIKIIEDNSLYRFDKEQQQPEKQAQYSSAQPVNESTPDNPIPGVPNSAVTTGVINGARYIIARKGDSFTTLSFKTGIPVKKLLKYNDLQHDVIVTDDTIIFTELKGKYSRNERTHTVKSKTNLYSLSQLYGIQLKSLRKMNSIRNTEAILPVGSVIYLR